jgi:hypothetical protein
MMSNSRLPVRLAREDMLVSDLPFRTHPDQSR